MGCNVFANMREIACKASSGKSICAFPDTCFTPPQAPPTPPGVPIPYPNTAQAGDTSKGTKKVKVKNKEVMLKNKSALKTSVGNEAGSTPKKGLLTSKTKGKAYFNSWSMDVKFEGKNVVRNLDLTTHNHGSQIGNTPTWPFLAGMDADAPIPDDDPCKKTKEAVKDNCADKTVKYSTGSVNRSASINAMCKDDKCKEARQCVLTQYSPNNCCPGSDGNQPTPHHIVLKSQFKMPGTSGKAIPLASGANYDQAKAPCVCASGNSHSVGKHGEIHSRTNIATRSANGVASGKAIPSDKRWSVGSAESVGAQAVADTNGCDKKCIEAQTREGHKQMGINKSDKIRPTTAGGEDLPATTGTGLG